jgi:hypothetical protein
VIGKKGAVKNTTRYPSIGSLEDPSGEKVDFSSIGHFPVGRHVPVQNHAEQEALVRLTRDEGGSAFASFQDKIDGAEIESSFLCFLPVTFDTVGSHEGAEISIEGEGGIARKGFRSASDEQERAEQQDPKTGKPAVLSCRLGGGGAHLFSSRLASASGPGGRGRARGRSESQLLPESLPDLGRDIGCAQGLPGGRSVDVSPLTESVVDQAKASMVFTDALGPVKGCTRIGVSGHVHDPLRRPISSSTSGKGANPFPGCHAVDTHPLFGHVPYRSSLDRIPFRKGESPLGGFCRAGGGPDTGNFLGHVSIFTADRTGGRKFVGDFLVEGGSLGGVVFSDKPEDGLGCSLLVS